MKYKEVIYFKWSYRAEILQEALETFKNYSPTNQPMAEGKILGGDECKYCQWRKQCNRDLVSDLPVQEKSNYEQAIEQRLLELATQRSTLVASGKDTTQQVRNIEQEIKFHLFF